MTNASKDKSSWAIGGGLLIGLGTGFFFLTINVLWFVACLLIGLGLGLLFSAFMSRTDQ